MNIFIELTVPSGDKVYFNLLEIVCIREYDGNAKTLITLTTGANIGVVEEYTKIKDRIEFRMEKIYGF